MRGELVGSLPSCAPELYHRRCELDQDYHEEKVVRHARQEEQDHCEHRGDEGVAGLPAPEAILEHPPPEQEEGRNEGEDEEHERRVVDLSVHRAWTGALYGVCLEGEKRHRKTRDEQERGPDFEPPLIPR